MKILNRYCRIHCILIIMMILCGCGSDNSAAGSRNADGIKREEAAYAAEPLSLPEYDSFDGACSNGMELHYAAADFNQASQQYETTFYTLAEGAAEPEKAFQLKENQRVQSMTMDMEGNIYCIGYEETSQEGQEKEAMMAPALIKLNQNGEILLSLELEALSEELRQDMIQGISVDEEKNIVLFSAAQNILVLNPDGRLIFKDRMAGRIFDICSSGGKVFAGYADGNGMSIKEIDIPGKKLAEKLQYNIPGKQFYMTAGVNGTLMIASEESVYLYAPEEEEVVRKFDWQTCDFTGMTAGILLPWGENGILTISRNYGTAPMQVEATIFSEAEEGEAEGQEKTVITLGAPDALPSGLSAEVVYFNKSNQDVKIEVKNYNEDYTRLYTEVISGNAPDILILPSDRIGQFAGTDTLEDLNVWFNEDESLNRADFLENILNAFEAEGHMYGMPLNFTISTIAGRTSALGEKPGWNLEELIDFVESHPEGTHIFDDESKSGVLRLLKYAYNDELVNADDQNQPLNQDLLIKMLEFANHYENDDQYIYDTNLAGKLAAEENLLQDTGVLCGYDYFGRSALSGGQITYIGYPAEGRNGNLIRSPYVFAISSGSGHKDIAWKFISSLLSEEVQLRLIKDYSTMGFYIRKDALEEYFTFCRENTSGYVMGTGGGGYTEYRFTPGDVREEDIEQVRNLIQKADTVASGLSEINQMIDEEAALYFNGSKSVEEVVGVIANRVRTYVDESK